MEDTINAAIEALKADTLPFLDVQRQRLKQRHLNVEQAAQQLKSRRRSAIALQRKLFLDMKNKAAPSVFLTIKSDFTVNLLAGIQIHTSSMGYLQHDLETTSRLGIVFSGRHLLGEAYRTHAWFFDRPNSEMKKCLTSPTEAADQYLGRALCGQEHLTCHLIDVQDNIAIPSKVSATDYESGIPGLEVTVAKGSNIDVDLIHLAETIACRADAVLNTISTRFSANLNYLKRREVAVVQETERMNQIERHLHQADENWALEQKIANEYRRWSECAILVNMGTEQDRLQHGTIEQVLTTTDLLLRVSNSELTKMIEKSRKEALYEETPRRWGIETISIPVTSPESVWAFRRCLLYLQLEWPKAPTMPKKKIERKRLWKAAAKFGILTKHWSKWFDAISSEEQWELHYSDMTFEKHDMPTEDGGRPEQTFQSDKGVSRFK